MARRASEEIIPRSSGTLITSERHARCLEQASAGLSQFERSLSGTIPLDVAVVDLYEATDNKDEAAKWRKELAAAKDPPKP